MDHAHPAGERVLEDRHGVLHVADVAVEVAPARAAPVVYHSQTQNLKLELLVVLRFPFSGIKYFQNPIQSSVSPHQTSAHLRLFVVVHDLEEHPWDVLAVVLDQPHRYARCYPLELNQTKFIDNEMWGFHAPYSQLQGTKGINWVFSIRLSLLWLW